MLLFKFKIQKLRKREIEMKKISKRTKKYNKIYAFIVCAFESLLSSIFVRVYLCTLYMERIEMVKEMVIHYNFRFRSFNLSFYHYLYANIITNIFLFLFHTRIVRSPDGRSVAGVYVFLISRPIGEHNCNV